MGVILDTNWRKVDDKGNASVGWAQTPSAYVRMTHDAREYAQSGFTHIKLPPVCKAGGGVLSDGYDLFDPLDIGSKNQCGAVRTAFGTADELRACVGSLHTNGMKVYGDFVYHQYGGGNGGNYKPIGAVKGAAGRFPKHPSCFVGAPPRVPVDPVPNSEGNFPFGDMCSYVNSTPAGYMRDGAIAATEWLVKTVGFDGCRIDDVKGTNADFIYDLITSPAFQKLDIPFGEYFEGNPAALGWWTNTLMKRKSMCIDFGFKFNVGNICNNSSRSWMGKLSDISYVINDPHMAVTFIDSTDTDTSYGEQTIWNKIFGYAIMLTFPGFPMVFYRDWSTDDGCYGLKKPINNLVWIHERLANGPFVPRLDTNSQVFAHERTGLPDLPGCVCFFNNDQWNDHQVTVPTTLGANTRVHEFTGLSGFLGEKWTDGSGNLTVKVPRNNNGYSYLVYGKPLPPMPFGLRTNGKTTQTWFGAAVNDLDIPGLTNGTQVLARFAVQAHQQFKAELTVKTPLPNGASITVRARDPRGTDISVGALEASGSVSMSGTVNNDLWMEIETQSMGIPTGGADWELTVTYVAPVGYVAP